MPKIRFNFRIILYTLFALILLSILVFFAGQALKFQESTIISTSTIWGFSLVIGLVILALLLLYGRIREFFFNLPLFHKALFLTAHIITSIFLTGDAASYFYLKANIPSQYSNTITKACPILSVNRFNTKIGRIQTVVTIDGIKKKLTFPNTDEYKALHKATYLNITTVHGRIGYDYIVSIRIVE